jgi:hypothetical protein
VKEQILVTEKAILEKLGWLLTVPTPYVFLVRYIKASIPSDQQVHKFRISFPKFRFPSVRGNLNNNKLFDFCANVFLDGEHSVFPS